MTNAIYYNNLVELPKEVQGHSIIGLENIKLKKPKQNIAKSLLSSQKIASQILNVVKLGSDQFS